MSSLMSAYLRRALALFCSGRLALMWRLGRVSGLPFHVSLLRAGQLAG